MAIQLFLTLRFRVSKQKIFLTLSISYFQRFRDKKNKRMTKSKSRGKPIKVYVRIRPFRQRELTEKEDCAVDIYPGDSERVRVTDLKCSYDTSYRFDRVFDASDSNKTVFHYTTR